MLQPIHLIIGKVMILENKNFQKIMLDKQYILKIINIIDSIGMMLNIRMYQKNQNIIFKAYSEIIKKEKGYQIYGHTKKMK